jgi:hypothetical protein
MAILVSILVRLFPSFEAPIDYCGILVILSLAAYLVVGWVREPIAPGMPGNKKRFRLRVILVSLVVLAVVTLFVWSEISVKHMEIYAAALRSVNSSQTSKQVLGQPIVAGWWTNYNIDLRGDGGRANLAILVSGDHGKGYIHVSATKAHGVWSITEMYMLKQGSTERVVLSD